MNSSEESDSFYTIQEAKSCFEWTVVRINARVRVFLNWPHKDKEQSVAIKSKHSVAAKRDIAQAWTVQCCSA